MVAQWMHSLSDAEKQLQLFEEKVAGTKGYIEKAVNTILDLKDKADKLALEGNESAVHETYLEMSALWKMLRGVEAAIRTRYPMIAAIADMLVYIYNLGTANHWSVVGMAEHLCVDLFPYIESLFVKIIAHRK